MRFLLSKILASRIDQYLTPQSFHELMTQIASAPLAGKVMKGSVGLRKIRFPDRLHNRGKRGGLRVIYRFDMSNNIILLYSVYRKTEQSDLVPRQRELFINLQFTDFTEADEWKIRRN